MENWIIPCSVKFYNVVEHLNKKNTIVWRKVSALKKGDIAYLYLGAPYSQIKYLCHVVDDNVDKAILAKNEYAIKKDRSSKRSTYILLKLDYTYPDGELSLTKLREHGLGQTQIQARTDRKLQQFIDSINKNLGVTAEQFPE